MTNPFPFWGGFGRMLVPRPHSGVTRRIVVAPGVRLHGSRGFLHIFIVYRINIQSRLFRVDFLIFIRYTSNMKTAAKKRSRGRPTIPSDKRKSETVLLRLDTAEKTAF